MTTQLSETIVSAIEADLKKSHGLAQEWETITPGFQEEIRRTWRALVERRDTDREWLSVREFRRRKAPHLGINLIYRSCGTGELDSIRIGGRILVASDALDRIAEGQREADGAEF